MVPGGGGRLILGGRDYRSKHCLLPFNRILDRNAPYPFSTFQYCIKSLSLASTKSWSILVLTSHDPFTGTSPILYLLYVLMNSWSFPIYHVALPPKISCDKPPFHHVFKLFDTINGQESRIRSPGYNPLLFFAAFQVFQFFFHSLFSFGQAFPWPPKWLCKTPKISSWRISIRKANCWEADASIFLWRVSLNAVLSISVLHTKFCMNSNLKQYMQ